ncbi:23S rRNA (cytosine1962-C5)-methyltransferase [Alkalihalobacillus xiaoxiensis]|uniref:23S rRNA (Cytosine1962-C5)-methyltransferase n=1 Tax=Shouchella xiaoxiensis TaxID=766895 RepID=A0ABS2T0L5_9BACI|nr:class I SAM-dependent rRNA methyltransferase [Shouchella xiaoxiensis]MBM7840555.1 23S rRNA (cytosine1962-C5)-methyltransferase [Shouchella xiaoxiensis]
MEFSERNVTIDDERARAIKSGYPLLDKEDVSMQPEQEGDIVCIRNKANEFVARAYLGKQNRGHGWVLTTKEHQKIDASFFQNKVESAVKKRTDLYNSNETTAFRVFNGEGDGIGGLTIDDYDGFYLLTWYSEGVYTFKEFIVQALVNTVSVKGIYEKKRFATDGKYVEDDDFVYGERGQFPLVVKESGMFFAVYLNDGPMTGIFLDQRNVRKQIRDRYAAGKKVLNLFSYTGAFSVAAALGGASQTTSVDLANRSRAKTEEQFLMNSIPLEQQNIVVMDAFRYFSYAKKKELEFDLIVLDPPSFARSKKRTFSAAKDYKALVKEAIPVTAQNGVIIASTNAANVSLKQFKRMIELAFKEENKAYKLLEEYGVPADFATTEAYPQGNYLKVLMIQVLSKG